MSIPGPGDESPRVTEQEIAVWLGLEESVATIRSLLDEQVRDAAGITLVQFGILQGLLRAPNGTRTMTEIADGLVSSRSGITYQVTKLVDVGLVERHASARDERAVEVTVTPAGRDRIARFRPAHDWLVRHLFFDRLAPGQLDTIAEVVESVQANLRQAPPRSARRRANRTA